MWVVDIAASVVIRAHNEGTSSIVSFVDHVNSLLFLKMYLLPSSSSLEEKHHYFTYFALTPVFMLTW